MAITIPTYEPAEFTAGDTTKWTKYCGDYLPDNSWVLTYTFVKSGIQKKLTATNNGDGKHLITITAAQSALWDPGTYQWQAVVTKSTDRYSVDKGSMIVLPDFAQQGSGYDGRSYWQIVLDNVQAVLQERATKDQASYTVNGRQLSRTPMNDLLVLESKAKFEVTREKRLEAIANGDGHSGKILTRF